MTDAELVVELTARRDYHRDQAERLDKAIEALEGGDDDTLGKIIRRGAKARRVKAEGKQGPRPTGMRRRVTAEDVARVRELKKAGKSWAEIRAATGLSTSTIARVLKG